MSFISEGVCWTDRLHAFARRMAERAARAERRGFYARLAQDRCARKRFLEHWDVRAAQFARCEDEPGVFLRDPEGVDGAVIELAMFTARYARDTFPGLYRIADEIAGIADRTRTFRQQLHLACPDDCRRAAHRAPAQA